MYIENFETIFGIKDNIQSLRNKVLELAIQGKLVEQDPNDESASELVRKIKEEKREFLSEGKIKKINPYFPIKEDEIPFKIPFLWEWIRFDDIAIFKKGPFGSSITKSMFVPKGNNTYKIYEQKNAIHKDNTLGEYYISEVKFNELRNFEVFPADIIVSCAGTIGETYILPSKIERGIINQALMRIDLSGLIEKEFFLMFFDMVLNSHITAKSKGSAMKNIPPLEVLKKIPFSLPSYKEQIRIIDRYKWFMSEIDKLEESLQKKEHVMELLPKAVVSAIGSCQTGEELKEQLQFVIENFETVFQTPGSMQELRNVVLQLAIEGKIVPQDITDEPASGLVNRIQVEKDKLVKEGKIRKQQPLEPIEEGEIPFEIPESWEWVRLGNVGDSLIGLTYSPDNVTSDGLPVLRSNNIQNGKMNYNKLVYVNVKVKKELIVQKDDILICARNGSKKLVGKSALINEESNGTMTFGAFMALFRSEINRYIYLMLNSNFFRSQLGDSNTMTVNQVTQSMLRNMLIPIPPQAEQQRIVQKVESIMSLIDQMEIKLKHKVDLVEKMAIV